MKRFERLRSTCTTTQAYRVASERARTGMLRSCTGTCVNVHVGMCETLMRIRACMYKCERIRRTYSKSTYEAHACITQSYTYRNAWATCAKRKRIEAYAEIRTLHLHHNKGDRKRSCTFNRERLQANTGVYVHENAR